jgi:DNA-binding NarL/FixJ family response regulator
LKNSIKDSDSYINDFLEKNKDLTLLLDSLNLDKNNISIPINIFCNRDLSALENIVNFLKNKGLPNNLISKYLNRDEHTISCVISRINCKLDHQNKKCEET